MFKPFFTLMGCSLSLFCPLLFKTLFLLALVDAFVLALGQPENGDIRSGHFECGKPALPAELFFSFFMIPSCCSLSFFAMLTLAVGTT